MINKSNSRLGLVGSLALHGALFGGVWAMVSQPKPQLLEEVSSISIEMIAARLEQPQVAVAEEIEPQAEEEIAEIETVLPEPEKTSEPEPVKAPVALPKPEPKPEPKPKEKPKEKPKDPPKPKELEKPKEKPKSEPKKVEKPKVEPRKVVKALETGKETKQGIVAKAVPNAFQGVKAQAGIANGSEKGNNPSINQAGAANGNTTQAGQNKVANSNEHNAYSATLQRVLQQRANSSYPQREKMMRKTGTVMLKFTLSPTGQISNVQVIKSSGNDNLDAAAVKAAQNSRPPAPPAGYPSSINVPVKFMLQ